LTIKAVVCSTTVLSGCTILLTKVCHLIYEKLTTGVPAKQFSRTIHYISIHIFNILLIVVQWRNTQLFISPLWWVWNLAMCLKQHTLIK